MKKFELLPKEVERIRVDDEPYLRETFYNVCKWLLVTYPNDVFQDNPIGKLIDTVKEIFEIKK